jgi:hypothetical protein
MKDSFIIPKIILKRAKFYVEVAVPVIIVLLCVSTFS